MAEPNKQQIGDGADSYGAAAQNAAKAAKQAANVGKEASKTAATTAAAKGAEATANAAAATVKAGVEGGKAVAEIAAGTASGGPWGAIIAAAWAMRHTLFKILVCICLCVVFLIVLIVELPGILINRALGLDGSQPTEQVTIVTVFETVTDVISNIIGLGYDSSMTQVETLIADGGYDYELSMNALVNHAQSSAGYDVAYIMSAYSTSVDQLSATQTDLEAKLSGVSGNMFPVTSIEKENEVITPVTYYTYKPVTMTVVTRIVQTGTINGVPQYRYETAEKTYYVQDEEKTSEVAVEVDAYTAVTVTLPVYSGGSISGTRTATYYQSAGKQTLIPTKEIVKYLECTIHPFDNTVISSAFGLDLNADYSQFGTTYGQVIDSRAQALTVTAVTGPAEYYVSVSGGSGTGMYEAGATVTIVADPPEAGKQFKEWSVGDGKVLRFTESDITSSTAKFVMPGEAVRISATYEDIPVTTYTVSFDANGGTGTMADVTGISGEYTLPENGFTAPDGKQFKAWSVGGSEKAVGDKITVTADTTVTAVWETIPAGHTCDIKSVAKVNPSCTEGGKEAYYKCEGCGKFYEDALGTKEITDLASWGNLAKLGHTESDWKSDKDNHWKECTVAACGVIIENSKAAHADANNDGKCDVCEYNVGKTSTNPGNKPSDDVQNPQTGDNSMMGLWIALLFVSGFGVVTTTVYGKKRHSVK